MYIRHPRRWPSSSSACDGQNELLCHKRHKPEGCCSKLYVLLGYRYGRGLPQHNIRIVRSWGPSNQNIVKSSQVVGLRDRVAIIRALLHAISSPHPYAGYGDLNGVGRRRNLSEAACYRNWPRSR